MKETQTEKQSSGWWGGATLQIDGICIDNRG